MKVEQGRDAQCGQRGPPPEREDRRGGRAGGALGWVDSQGCVWVDRSRHAPSDGVGDGRGAPEQGTRVHLRLLRVGVWQIPIQQCNYPSIKNKFKKLKQRKKTPLRRLPAARPVLPIKAAPGGTGEAPFSNTEWEPGHCTQRGSRKTAQGAVMPRPGSGRGSTNAGLPPGLPAAPHHVNARPSWGCLVTA